MLRLHEAESGQEESFVTAAIETFVRLPRSVNGRSTKDNVSRFRPLPTFVDPACYGRTPLQTSGSSTAAANVVDFDERVLSNAGRTNRSKVEGLPPAHQFIVGRHLDERGVSGRHVLVGPAEASDLPLAFSGIRSGNVSITVAIISVTALRQVAWVVG